MAEPVDLAEFWALERDLSTAAPQKNTETARIPTRAALKNSPQNTEQPRLLDQVRAKMRLAHYSIRTESAYVDWIKRFIFFHNKRHPREMGAAEITSFLTELAVNGNVTASTQNKALSALLFLYRIVLEVQLPLIDAVRASAPRRLPVVLSAGGHRFTPGRECSALWGRVCPNGTLHTSPEQGSG